jgi:hypothetical protein
MMNRKVSAVFILVAMTSIIIVLNSFSIVFADEDFCYDQAGNGHLCFHQRDTCKFEQKHDYIADTPCYNKIEHHNGDIVTKDHYVV